MQVFTPLGIASGRGIGQIHMYLLNLSTGDEIAAGFSGRMANRPLHAAYTLEMIRRVFGAAAHVPGRCGTTSP
jgi:hypothetical protein